MIKNDSFNNQKPKAIKKPAQQYIITNQKVLNDSEAASLRKLCTRYLGIEREARNALIILLTLECGLRASEALGITISDCDFSKKPSVYIRSLKNSTPRVLPIRRDLAHAIEQTVLKVHPGVDSVSKLPKETLIFPISYARLEQIWRMMRPNPTKTLHCLRHTFAVETFLKTKDILFVQRALGHKNVENTLIYADFVYSSTAMRKVMVVGED